MSETSIAADRSRIEQAIRNTERNMADVDRKIEILAREKTRLAVSLLDLRLWLAALPED